MKQYLLLVDDVGMSTLKSAIPSIQFLEVQGMDVGNNNSIKLLVTPVLPPVTPADVPVIKENAVVEQSPPEEPQAI